MMNLTHNDLQLLESTQRIATSKIVNGVFVFDESTQDLSFVDLIHHEELREIRFVTPQPNLRYLDASRCGLVQIVFSKRCDALQSIYLHHNQLTAFDIQVELPSLELLDLSFNEHLSAVQFKSVLPKLMYLYLHKCDLRDLEPLVGYFLREVFDFNIEGNGNMILPPISYVERGKNAVVRYFKTIEKTEEEEYIYEAKLIILGAPESGKTTLARKMKNKGAAMTKKEERTYSIELTKWEFSYVFEGKGEQEVVVNIWDFGGQTILMHTHRFFLSKRSVYIILADGAKDGKKYFKYWIHQTKEFAGNSPVVIFINEVRGNKIDVKKGDWQKLNPNLVNECIGNDLDKVAETESVQFERNVDYIKAQVVSLKDFGERVISGTSGVRKTLLKWQAENLKVIKKSEFIDICIENGIKDEQSQMDLSYYFHHQIGIFLHFQENEILQRKIFIDNQWVLNGAYSVLRNEKVSKNKGKLKKSEFWGLFSEEYKEYRLELKELLKVFYIIYEKDDYIVVPQHLSVVVPEYEFDEKESVQFTFQYNRYMPVGILWQFIVTNNLFIMGDLVWKEGVVLQFQDTIAEIIEDTDNDLIRIRVLGPEREDLRAKIIYAFEVIHKGFTELDVKRHVPCQCSECSNSSTSPHVFDYSYLQKLRNKKIQDVRCEISLENVIVEKLLRGIYIEQIGKAEGIRVEGSGNVIIVDVKKSKIDISQKVPSNLESDRINNLATKKDIAGIHNHLTQQDAQLEDIKAIGQKYIDSLSESQKELNDSMNILIAQTEKAEMETILHEMQSMMNDQFKKDELAQINQLINNERTDMAVKMKFMIPLVIAKAEIEFSRKMKVPQTWQEFKALFVKNN